MFKKIKNALRAALIITGLAVAANSASAEELQQPEVVETTMETVDETVDFDFSFVDFATEETPVVEEVAEVTSDDTTVAEVPVTNTAEIVADDEVVPAVADTTVEEAPSSEIASTNAANDVVVVEEVAEVTSNDADVTEVPEMVLGDIVVPETPVVEETVDETPVDNTNITGHQEGSASRGYAVLSDGNEAYCVQEEYEHIDENASYTKVDVPTTDVNLNSVFVAITEADEAGEDKDTTRQIAQLAIWKILNPAGKYQDSVSFFYGESGLKLFEKMISSVDTTDWDITSWGYTPNGVNQDGFNYQNLISGKATRVKHEVPDEPTPEEPTPDEPTPETPDEPEVPDVPDVPEQPEVPDKPEVPVTPEQPTTPEQPSTPDVPQTQSWTETVEETVPAIDTLSWTDAPQTGDSATGLVVCFSMLIIGLFMVIASAKKIMNN